MDSLHEAHLERILENRRRRGVLGIYGVHPGSSTAAQTQQWRMMDKNDPSATTKFGPTSPSPRQVPVHTTAEEAAPRAASPPSPPSPPVQAPQAVIAGTPPSGRYGVGIDDSHRSDRLAHNGSNVGYGGLTSDRRVLRFDERSIGNSGKGRGWSTYDSRSTWRPWRNSPACTDGDPRNTGASYVPSVRRSLQPTVPLLTYGKPIMHYSSSLERDCVSRRERTVSPYFRRAEPDYMRPHRRRAASRSPRNTESWRYRPYGRSLNNYADVPRRTFQSPTLKRWRSRASGLPHEFPKEPDMRAAGSVIYGAVAQGEGTASSPASYSSCRLPPGPPLPTHGSTLPSAGNPNYTAPNNDATGLPNTRTTMDIRTSVSILAAGDWFYKWNSKGTSVSPRWVWLDTQSHLLLWAHRETYESAFAGTIKLEKLIQITTHDMQQLNNDGNPHTYYVLLVETTKRVLQLATERRAKADAWHEALNNVMSYLRSQNCGGFYTYSTA